MTHCRKGGWGGRGEIGFVSPMSLRNDILTRLLPNRRLHLIDRPGFNRNQWE